MRSLAIVLLLLVPTTLTAQDSKPPKAEAVAFPFRKHDRVAWVGSSSTHIGVWPRTLEFLLRTRHPELELSFRRFSTGGGTFATGAQKLPGWLGQFEPTLVIFNYGGNDARAGEKGLPDFERNIDKCLALLKEYEARFVFSTHQAADVRKSGVEAAARRKRYAEHLIKLGHQRGWTVVDVFHPLDELQRLGQARDDSFTILKDTIHLTNSAYLAWGFYLYAGLNPPEVVSTATLRADGVIVEQRGCTIGPVGVREDGLEFRRSDAVMPVLPPGPLPPADLVPLEKYSAYRLQVTGLPAGDYELTSDGKPLATVSAAALATGVNLNTLALASGKPAPWSTQAEAWWKGEQLDGIGKLTSQWRIRRIGSP